MFVAEEMDELEMLGAGLIASLEMAELGEAGDGFLVFT